MAFLVVFFFIILLFCGTCISGHSPWAIVGDRRFDWMKSPGYKFISHARYICADVRLNSIQF